MKNKLILYDIFSYSCMNCLRSSGYIKKIDNRYKKYALSTILIHPPEWEFEKDKNNIISYLKRYNIRFPLILDPEKKKIKKFGINFWPAQILMNKEKIIYKHIGEGNYQKLENHIIEGLKIKNPDLKRIFSQEPEYSKYPAVYCGKRKKGNIADFGIVSNAKGWKQEDEFLRSTADSQSLKITSKGKIINFVAQSLTKKPIKVSVRLNNKNIKTIEINKPQLYKLLQMKSRPQNLTLSTEKNLAIYSFSFQ